MPKVIEPIRSIKVIAVVVDQRPPALDEDGVPFPVGHAQYRADESRITAEIHMEGTVPQIVKVPLTGPVAQRMLADAATIFDAQLDDLETNEKEGWTRAKP